MHAGQPASVDRLEADGSEVAWILQAAAFCQLLKTVLHGDGMIGGGDRVFVAIARRFDKARRLRGPDAFDAAARNHALVRHIEEAVLEAGAAQVGDKNEHQSYFFKKAARTDSSGRGMTWALTSSPNWPAAAAPASTAARTEPTSPRTNVVT